MGESELTVAVDRVTRQLLYGLIHGCNYGAMPGKAPSTNGPPLPGDGSASATYPVAVSHQARVNPISGRLLATPISGKGGLFSRTPLDISGSYRSIFKIQTAFVSPQHDLHF